ncbi:MAG: histidinol-phosphatase [Verrucomicrobiales bacterium]|nr:histidinol-phosphatase [Verrucomicrobiales bacterium]
MAAPVLFDSHMHTPLCKHAVGEPLDYVKQGVKVGLKGVIFTCHSPMPDRFSHRVRMEPAQFYDYVQMVDHARRNAPDGFEVRLGMESDWFPGMESWLTELHDSEDFHYLLGSVHWHIPEYLDAFWSGDVPSFRRQYFDHLAESAESGLFDCLSHPDLVKNASPDDWDFEEMRDDIARALDRIAKTGVAMELNTSGQHKGVPENNPGPEMLTMIHERNIPVVLGSDSHQPGRVGETFLNSLDQLAGIGFETVSVFKNRTRSDISIAEAKSSLGA